MHEYIKSIGYSSVKTVREEKDLLDEVLWEPKRKKMISNPADLDSFYAELSGEVAKGAGLRLIGQYDEYEQFRLDNYYPYYEGRTESMNGSCHIGRKMDSMSFSGMCDDLRVGGPLIFHVVNTLDCIEKHEPADEDRPRKVNLSGLSLEGAVLLPTMNTASVLADDGETAKETVKMAEMSENSELDELGLMALENLDNLGHMLSRIGKEDLFSIVETTFLPFGLETELYKIVGIIEKVDSFVNKATMEKVFIMKLLCNDIPLDVCINEAQLMGEPAPGRRFRGVIWLQGLVK